MSFTLYWPEFLILYWINFMNIITPGPGFTVVIHHSAFHHRKLGIMTGLGITAAGLIHKTYILLGFGIIADAPTVVFRSVQYMGGFFLMHLGIKTIFTQLPDIKGIKKSQNTLHETIKGLTAWKAFSIGFWVNFLNPMTSVSFLSIVLATISPETPLWLRGAYSGVLALTSIIWFSLIAFFFSGNILKKFINKFEKPINYMAGGFLIYLGLSLLFGG